MDHIEDLVRELEEITDIKQNCCLIGSKLHYNNGRKWLIGSGATCNVFLGLFEETKPVAVKRIPLDIEHDNDILDEAKLMLRIDGHPNILRYYCTEINDNFRFIVTEICYGTLEDLVKGKYGGPSIGDDREVLHQVTRGVEYLHERSIVHRDIKPINIFISQPYGDSIKPQMKIADFGGSEKKKKFNKSPCNPAGTMGWVAPECFDISGYSVDEKLDVFSLGCIYGYTLSEGYKHPFGDNPYQRCVDIEQKMPMSLARDQLKPMYSQCPFVFSLICCMVDMTPHRRPTV